MDMRKLQYLFLVCILFAATGSIENNHLQQPEKLKLLYVYDPLCGWCYGFGPVVEKIEQNFKEDIDVEIISGGMVMGDRIAPVGAMSAYILEAIPRLERMTGAEFGQPYITLLKEGSYVTSSEKPSVALCVYKSFKNDSSVSYGHAIQTAFYKEGKDLNNDTLYADIAHTFGLDKVQFLARMKDPVHLKEAHNEFARASALGVAGFPALMLKKGNEYVRLSEGYATYESLEKSLRKQIKSAEKK